MQNCWRLHHVTISWWIDSNFSNYISKWFYQSFLYNMNSLLLPNMNLPTNSNEYQLHWINFLQIYQNCKRNARTTHQTLNELKGKWYHSEFEKEKQLSFLFNEISTGLETRKWRCDAVNVSRWEHSNHHVHTRVKSNTEWLHASTPFFLIFQLIDGSICQNSFSVQVNPQ